MSETPVPESTTLDEKKTEAETAAEVSVENLDFEMPDLDSNDEDEVFETPTFKELLKSEDQPSRFTTLLSAFFAVLTIICFTLLVYLVWSNRGKYHGEHEIAETAEVEKNEFASSIYEPVGSYHLNLQSKNSGSLEAEIRVDLVAECNSKHVCDTLKTKTIEVRDLIMPILSASEPSDWLNPSGKNRIRRRVAEQLSGIVEGGTVLNVHISDLQVERLPVKK